MKAAQRLGDDAALAEANAGAGGLDQSRLTHLVGYAASRAC